jgi:hypothetical protein
MHVFPDGLTCTRLATATAAFAGETRLVTEGRPPLEPAHGLATPSCPPLPHPTPNNATCANVGAHRGGANLACRTESATTSK